MILGVAIQGGTLQERFNLQQKINELEMNKDICCDFIDAPLDIAFRLTGIPIQSLVNNEVSNSYMESQWDYIRDERHTDTKGAITRKPVRYRLSPGRILSKVIELGRNIHSNAWVNALDARVTLDDSVCLFEFPNEYSYLSDKDAELVQYVIDDKARSFVNSLKFTKTFTSERDLLEYIKTKFNAAT